MDSELVGPGLPVGTWQEALKGLEHSFLIIEVRSFWGSLWFSGFLDSDSGLYALMDYAGNGQDDVYLNAIFAVLKEGEILIQINKEKKPPEGALEPGRRYPLSQTEASSTVNTLLTRFSQSASSSRPRMWRSEAVREYEESMRKACGPGLDAIRRA